MRAPVALLLPVLVAACARANDLGTELGVRGAAPRADGTCDPGLIVCKGLCEPSCTSADAGPAHQTAPDTGVPASAPDAAPDATPDATPLPDAAVPAADAGEGADALSPPALDAGTAPDAAPAPDGSLRDAGAGPPCPDPMQVAVIASAVHFLDEATQTLTTTPLVGADVVFHDNAGLMLSRTVTGADGTACATVPPNGMVTVSSSIAALRTYLAVNPGDTVTYQATANGQESIYGSPNEHLTLIPNAAWPGATRYAIRSGFGYDANTTTTAWTQNVHADLFRPPSMPTYDLTVIAVGPMPAYTQLRAIAAGTTTIAVGAWRTDFPTIELEIANFQGGINQSPADWTNDPGTSVCAGDTCLLLPTFQSTPGGGQRVVARTLPASPAAGVNVTVTELNWGQLGFRTFHFPAGTTSAAISGFDLFPFPKNISVDATNPDRPVTTWDASWALGNVGVTATVALPTSATVLELQLMNGDWRIQAPGSVLPPVRAPELPQDLLAPHMPFTGCGVRYDWVEGATYQDALRNNYLWAQAGTPGLVRALTSGFN
jgi:hypothetical protein